MRPKYKPVCLIISCLCLCFYFRAVPSYGQNLLEKNKYFRDDAWASKVKLIDEFIDRFNNQIKFNDKGVVRELSLSAEDHKKMLSSLFYSNTESIDSLVLEKFLNVITDPINPQTIKFYEGGWYAEILANIDFEGKQSLVSLIMRIETYENNTSQWVLHGAYAPFLSYSGVDKSSVITINPSNHNLRFSDLNEVLLKGKPEHFISKELKIDHLSVLIYLLKESKASISGIREIRYHFLQIDGYTFTVQNYQQNGFNSGWLINKLIPTDKTGKERYLRDVLKLNYR